MPISHFSSAHPPARPPTCAHVRPRARASASPQLWSISDFGCVRTLEGHAAGVLRVAFLSAGMALLSAAADGLLKLWAVRGAECVNTFDQHTDKVRGSRRVARPATDACALL